MPAAKAYFFTTIQNITRDMATPGLDPWVVTNKSSVCLPASKVARAVSKYCRNHCAATSPKGTRRSFAPLPITRSTFSFKPTFKVFSVTNSLTRSPLAYINSNIVRSRTPKAVPVSGAANKSSTWASVKVLGTRNACFAACSFKVGSTWMRPSRKAHRK